MSESEHCQRSTTNPSSQTEQRRSECERFYDEVYDWPDKDAFGIDQQGGKGNASYTSGVAPTLAGDSHGTPHATAYGICSYDSNAMKSPNPHSGFYKADTSRTLDLNGGNPACHQGGVLAVAYPTAVDCRNGTENPFVNGTLQAKEQGQNLNSNNIVRVPIK